MGDDLKLESPQATLLKELSAKREQTKAALSKCHGLPFAVIQSDTHPKLKGIWCDNGMAGIGQVAIVTREFHEGQAEALCHLANLATWMPDLIDALEAAEAREKLLNQAVGAILDQLTDNQKQALLHCEADGNGRHSYAINALAKFRLMELQHVTKPAWPDGFKAYRLSPLGIAARQALKETDDGQG